jgi:uncharacterized protein YndB with AHSA1/START domain
LNRGVVAREDASMPPQYRFVDEWFVPMPIEQAYDLLGDPLRYPEWWPEAFPQATGDPGPPKPGNRVDVLSKGFLPYRLRWTLTCVSVERPSKIDAEMTGDFEGTSAWTLTEVDGGTRAVLDFRPAVAKPLVRNLTPLLRPLFAANHRWAMRKGEEAARRVAVESAASTSST